VNLTCQKYNPAYLTQMVTIKRLKKKYTTWQQCLKLPEVKALRCLPPHPNITHLKDLIYDCHGTVFLLFDYMNGGNLYESMIRDNIWLSKDRSEKKVVIRTVMRQLLQALACVHERGLIHRDIKPENLLLHRTGREGAEVEKRVLEMKGKEGRANETGAWSKTDNLSTLSKSHSPPPHRGNTLACAKDGGTSTDDESAESFRIKLADFGLARSSRSGSFAPLTTYIGTRWYRAPEIIRHSSSYGWPVDIWAMGCVFYELLTLQPLFPGDSEAETLAMVENVLGSASTEGWGREGKLQGRAEGLARLLPLWVEPEAADLLKSLLRLKPQQRPTAEQALKHPYFRGKKWSVEERQAANGASCVPPSHRPECTITATYNDGRFEGQVGQERCVGPGMLRVETRGLVGKERMRWERREEEEERSLRSLEGTLDTHENQGEEQVVKTKDGEEAGMNVTGEEEEEEVEEEDDVMDLRVLLDERLERHAAKRRTWKGQGKSKLSFLKDFESMGYKKGRHRGHAEDGRDGAEAEEEDREGPSRDTKEAYEQTFSGEKYHNREETPSAPARMIEGLRRPWKGPRATEGVPGLHAHRCRRDEAMTTRPPFAWSPGRELGSAGWGWQPQRPPSAKNFVESWCGESGGGRDRSDRSPALSTPSYSPPFLSPCLPPFSLATSHMPSLNTLPERHDHRARRQAAGLDSLRSMLFPPPVLSLRSLGPLGSPSQAPALHSFPSLPRDSLHWFASSSSSSSSSPSFASCPTFTTSPSCSSPSNPASATSSPTFAPSTPFSSNPSLSLPASTPRSPAMKKRRYKGEFALMLP